MEGDSQQYGGSNDKKSKGGKKKSKVENVTANTVDVRGAKYYSRDWSKTEGAVYKEVTNQGNKGVIRKEDCECAKRTNKKDPCARKIMRKEVPVLKIEDLVSITEVNEEELIKLVDTGPVIVSLQATDELRSHIGEGIYYGPKTSKKPRGDHVVLLVGYNSLNGNHYWIIQNSWGTTWGDGGFAKISRACSRVGCQNQSLFSEIVYPLVSTVDGFK
ncbi:oryzain alpha chain-like [Brassica napus]|uniref:oryzain alpha chain-like n=1 Tax=Brassica napus TaxID=3708 RepID=UPI0020788BBC|nr:oryzain alpha chain-like [Brassica napus]